MLDRLMPVADELAWRPAGLAVEAEAALRASTRATMRAIRPAGVFGEVALEAELVRSLSVCTIDSIRWAHEAD